MNCPRCQGFIVREYLNAGSEEGNRPLDAIRCVNCGFVADQLMMERFLCRQQEEVQL